MDTIQERTEYGSDTDKKGYITDMIKDPFLNWLMTLINKYIVTRYCEERGLLKLLPFQSGKTFKGYLSNFTICALLFGIYYSVEQAFQHKKLLLCAENEDEGGEGKDKLSKEILRAKTSKDAKSLGGKKIYKKYKLKLDLKKWIKLKVREEVMEECLNERFKRDEKFRSILYICYKMGYIPFHTERSGKDSFWGGSLKEGVRGKNILGELMRKISIDKFSTMSSRCIDCNTSIKYTYQLCGKSHCGKSHCKDIKK